ncbi:nucleotide exchange factor GrpE [candidate division KSB1 bacterium]|nr:MAG: nucleotide exchange factor GrpE [candidate division KSB1 bacterium]
MNNQENEQNPINGEPDNSEKACSETPVEAENGRIDLSAELEKAVAEWQDKYLRKLAEFDNFRKRTRQEQESLRQWVIESLLVNLLPVMDDFDRMLAMPANGDDAFRKGVEMIREKFRGFLESCDVKKFECVGQPFNPDEHDALMTRPTPDFPAHTVLDVITPGYRMGDRVIRHAQVVVSSEPEERTEDGN